jgi:hypothetical protein
VALPGVGTHQDLPAQATAVRIFLSVKGYYPLPKNGWWISLAVKPEMGTPAVFPLREQRKQVHRGGHSC